MEATFVRNLSGFAGDARLYELSAPITFEHGSRTEFTNYVIASGISGFATETYLFPANSDGDVLDWLELPGSFQGAIDHDRAINGLVDHENAKAVAA